MMLLLAASEKYGCLLAASEKYDRHRPSTSASGLEEAQKYECMRD